MNFGAYTKEISNFSGTIDLVTQAIKFLKIRTLSVKEISLSNKIVTCNDSKVESKSKMHNWL